MRQDSNQVPGLDGASDTRSAAPFHSPTVDSVAGLALTGWTLIGQDSLDSYRDGLPCKQAATGIEVVYRA